MSLVIDSSMTLAWYFEDEKTAASIAVLNRVAEAGAIVPALWHFEVPNGLQVAVRRGRITLAYRDASLDDLPAPLRLYQGFCRGGKVVARSPSCSIASNG